LSNTVISKPNFTSTDLLDEWVCPRKFGFFNVKPVTTVKAKEKAMILGIRLGSIGEYDDNTSNEYTSGMLDENTKKIQEVLEILGLKDRTVSLYLSLYVSC
jgi:hypothetical protein